MPVWVVTGKLGAGKTLMAVSRIQKYLMEGRKVATNLNIYPEAMLGINKKKTELYRLPDIPTITDLKALPLGYDDCDIDESKNGLLVLDETGIFLNSRNWNAPGRAEVNAYFKLLRKLRWDAIFIIQDIDNLDSDARRTIAEHTVYCRRMDRMAIPFVGSIFRALTGYAIPLPQLHIGIVKYGTESSSMKVDQWNYYGKGLYDAYDTEQLFSETENYSGINALSTVLPTYYTHGRYITTKQRIKNAISNFKITGFRCFLAGVLLSAFAVNALVTVQPQVPKKGVFTCNDAYKELFGSCSSKPIAPYEYYYPKPEQSSEISEPDTPGQSSDHIELEKIIYISGWQLTTKGYQMTFVDGNGEPYYPLTYLVREMRDCVARVQIDGVTKRLTCMPDEMLYAKASG